MFNLFPKRPAPRVVSVTTIVVHPPLAANIDVPAYMRRTPRQEAEIALLRVKGKSLLNHGILHQGRVK